MFKAAKPRAEAERILVVRLSSMGDVIHTLPAVATLKHSFPRSEVTWVISPRWAPLLEGNPFVSRVVLMDRHHLRSVAGAWRELHRTRFDLAIDFQGLIQSALVGSLARPERFFGFHQSQARERLAALFYSTRVRAPGAHIVDRNLELACEAGASMILRAFPLPPGEPEGELPQTDFVLACPLAGWGAKQWPLQAYAELARLLREELALPLVVNGPPSSAPVLARIGGARVHTSGLPGLIHATRRALAVVGSDSGPVHLAAALGKPGVAIFGPTDPARNGPYGGSFTVLRDSGAVTSYRRVSEPDANMRAILPAAVFESLLACIGAQRHASA